MATKKKSDGFGLVITRSKHGSVTNYRGTQAALIAAGVCSEEQFPLAPQRKGSGTNSKGWWTVTRRRGGVFELERREPSCAAELNNVLTELVGSLGVATVDPDTGERLTLEPESRDAIVDAMLALDRTIRSARMKPVRRLRAVRGT